jgi:VIT1/CCC1 family predicted Fe2+/Mn2+ transporter
MSTAVRARRGPRLTSLLVGAALVAAVALAGWLMLLFIKGTVVLISYAIGVALIVLPLLLVRRVVGGHTGVERRQRLGTVAQAVGLGVALCVVAYFVGQHGWLLIAVPAAVVAVLRIVSAVSARRQVSAADSGRMAVR